MTKPKKEIITTDQIQVGDNIYWYQLIKLGEIPQFNECKKIGGVVASITDAGERNNLKIVFEPETEIAMTDSGEWIKSEIVWPAVEIYRVAEPQNTDPSWGSWVVA